MSKVLQDILGAADYGVYVRGKKIFMRLGDEARGLFAEETGGTIDGEKGIVVLPSGRRIRLCRGRNTMNATQKFRAARDADVVVAWEEGEADSYVDGRSFVALIVDRMKGAT